MKQALDITIIFLVSIASLVKTATPPEVELPTRRVVQSSLAGADPFAEHGPDVGSLYSPESKHFAFKMTEHKGDLQKRRSIVKKQSYWDWLLSFVLGAREGNGAYRVINQTTYYLGTLYFGKHYESMPVIFDSGSAWPIVLGYTCETCQDHSGLYDYSDEVGITFYEKENSQGERNYGSAKTWGFEATDWVCLVQNEEDSCSKAQEIFVVLRQEGLPVTIGGIMGLGPGADDDDDGPSFIKALKAADAISDPVFAFYLQGDNVEIATGTNSYLDVGVIQNSRMSNVADLVTIPILEDEDNTRWSSYVTGIKFGATDEDAWAFE